MKSPRRVILSSWVVLSLIAATLTYYAVTSRGFTTQKPELNDGGIWVTSNEVGGYGRLNKPIGQLDTVVASFEPGDMDVVQSGAAVVVEDHNAGQVQSIDPSSGKIAAEGKADIPDDAVVGLGGQTLATLDPKTGHLWSTQMDVHSGGSPLTAVDAASKAPASVGTDAAMAVSTSGTVFAASAKKRTVYSFAEDGGALGKAEKRPLGFRPEGALSIAGVGNHPVVLDPKAGILDMDGDSTSAPAESRLQQSGPASDSVLLATSTSLNQVSMGGGDTRDLYSQVQGDPAAPVRLAGCAYGAWGGAKAMLVTACDGEKAQAWSLGATSSDLVFRTNRNQITLNDRESGAAWVIDNQKPVSVRNWQDFNLKKVEKPDDKQDQKNEGDAKPPQTKPDDLGARPGRITVLNVLDNDSAPKGTVLAVSAVSKAPSGVTLSRSPDLQTVLADVPATQSQPFKFTYEASNGKGKASKPTEVTVTPRMLGSSSAPPTRPTGFKGDPQLVVASGGVITFPVLSNWRDYADGDSLNLQDVAVDGGRGLAGTTPDGLLRFRAGDQAGTVGVKYVVGDSAGGKTARQTYNVKVLDRKVTKSVPPVSEADVASGKAMQTIVIRPLLNDLPGADPLTQDPQLHLARPATVVSGGKVSKLTTDLGTGEISLTPGTSGTFTLNYQVQYGDSAAAPGLIRVDVARAVDQSPPVAGPDSIVVHDRIPTDVDVLANDFDPAGGVLSVQNATAAGDERQLQVAIIRGRWLRIIPNTSDLPDHQAVVRYTVTNGSQIAHGQLIVSQRPADQQDAAPVAQDDQAVVRAGDTVAIPVLDNDFSPNGGPMSINVPTVKDRGSGELQVVPAIGHAYVSGSLVRYVPPATVDDETTVRISYQPTNGSGTGDGTAVVSIKPAPSAKLKDNPPTPSAIEDRVVTGDTAVVKLPTSGQDPDGDSVSIIGVNSAPMHGRVMGYGANSITYQAYPNATGGTDEFEAVVADPFGLTGIATVRIGVAPPGEPQAPVAVDDEIKVRPGADVTIDPLANDHVAPGQSAQIEPLEAATHGIKLAGRSGPVTLKAPEDLKAPPVKQPYVLTNGMAEASATMTVRLVPGYNNPPVVFDAFAKPVGGSGAIKYNVLRTAYDPDGSSKDLKVSSLDDPAHKAQLDGSTVTAKMTGRPQVIPFTVTDGDGGAATAALYVPAKGAGAPYVRTDALIKVPAGGKKAIDINDYVVDPEGQEVALTVRSAVWTSPPEGLGFRFSDGLVLQGKKLRSGAQYVGPAALTVEVTDSTKVTDDSAHTAIVTIPVQVGDPSPVLTCPSGALTLSQGEQQRLDIASLCHVWTPKPSDAADLDFDVKWEKPISGVDITKNGTHLPRLDAGISAGPGTGTLTVGTVGSKSARASLKVQLVKAPPPLMMPMSFDNLQAGKPFQVDLAGYLRPGVTDPKPALIKIGSDKVIAVKQNGTRVTLTPRDGAYHAHVVLPVVMSDAGADAGQERRAAGELVLDVAGKPGAPGRPISTGKPLSHQVRLSWSPAAANGSAITHYTVYANGAKVQECAGTGCMVTGLTNGKDYSFQVTATNVVGEGTRGASASYMPNEVPRQVTGIRFDDPQNHSVRLTWNRAATEGSPVTDYVVSVDGNERHLGTATSTRLSLADNNRAYSVIVFAVNKLGPGDPGKISGVQSSGRPGAPPGMGVDNDESASSDTSVVTVHWGASDAQGPKPLIYHVTRDGHPLCDTKGQSCKDTVDFDGVARTYAVTASNATPGAGHTSSASTASITPVGKPAEWGGWEATATGENNTAQVSFTIPSSRGKQSQSSVKLMSDGAVVRSWSGRSGSVVENVNVGSNGNNHDLQLTQCNEKNNCTDSATRSVTPYGPLNDSSVVDASSSVSGTSVSWSVTVNTNGRAASVRVTSNQGRSWGPQNVDSGAGQQTIQLGGRDIGFSASEQITVYISDGGRGSGQRSFTSATTQAPPQPAVEVWKGANATAGTCTSAPNCWHIGITTHNFPGNVTCSMHASIGDAGFVPTSMGPNERKQSQNVAGRNVTVWTTCGGVESPHVRF